MASQAELDEIEQERIEFAADMKESGFLAGFGLSKTVAHRGTEYIEKCEEYFYPIDAKKIFTDVLSGEYGIMVANFNNGILSDCKNVGSKSRIIKESKPFPQGSPVIIYYELLIKGNPL